MTKQNEYFKSYSLKFNDVPKEFSNRRHSKKRKIKARKSLGISESGIFDRRT